MPSAGTTTSDVISSPSGSVPSWTRSSREKISVALLEILGEFDGDDHFAGSAALDGELAFDGAAEAGVTARARRVDPAMMHDDDRAA